MSVPRALCLLALLLCVSAAWAQGTPPPLVASTAAVSVALRVQPTSYQASIEVKEAATVKLYCPLKPGLVSFTGLSQKTEVAYDAKARTLTMSLPPGKFVISVRPY